MLEHIHIIGISIMAPEKPGCDCHAKSKKI